MLSRLGDGAFDELWLFAVDTGQGLTPREREALFEFHARGGGILTARDHQDLGASLCGIPCSAPWSTFTVFSPRARRRGASPTMTTRRSRGPTTTLAGTAICSRSSPRAPPIRSCSATGTRPRGDPRPVPRAPARGGGGPPPGDPSTRVVAEGHSTRTGAPSTWWSPPSGRAATTGGCMVGPSPTRRTSTTSATTTGISRPGAPTFVDDPPEYQVAANRHALDDIKTYVRNAARWLAPADG